MKGKRSAFLAPVLVLILLLMTSPPAWANRNEATQLVAPVAFFPGAGFGAPGPFTTRYFVSAMSIASTVNVKCFTSFGALAGPAAGTNVVLGAFDMDILSPESLGLNTDAGFTTVGGGVGWCYFTVTAGDDVAVGVFFGLSGNGGGSLLQHPASRIISGDTAQSQITDDDANVPLWVGDAAWNTFLVGINPTTTSRTLTIDVYNTGGTLVASPSCDAPFGARDIDFCSLSGAAGAAAVIGAADINVSGLGFVGWIVALNFATGESFMYPVPLDKDDVSLISTLGIAP